MRTIGKIIKELRIEHNETQDDLSKILNISNQSISKWERDIAEPSIELLKAIANHYNVSMDYITQSDYKNVIEFEVEVNKKAKIMVWTDFEYLNSIAPKATLDTTRKTPGKWFLPTHPAPKDYLVIGIDKTNEICFLGMHYNYSYPTCGPLGMFYSKSSEKYDKNPCLIVKETYKLDQDHRKDFEFVIPKDGFIIALPFYELKTRNLLSSILPSRLKQYVIANYNNLFNQEINGYKFNKNFFNEELLSDELNEIKVSLNKNVVSFVMPKGNTNHDNENINQLLLENKMLQKKIIRLESELDDLKAIVEDIELNLSEE